jgi:hypothetical protein
MPHLAMADILEVTARVESHFDLPRVKVMGILHAYHIGERERRMGL